MAELVDLRRYAATVDECFTHILRLLAGATDIAARAEIAGTLDATLTRTRAQHARILGTADDRLKIHVAVEGAAEIQTFIESRIAAKDAFETALDGLRLEVVLQNKK